MQKKLLAVAVAGALGAPALAQAQASTVQVFGNLYGEYAWINQGRAPTGTGNPLGAERVNVDMLQTPGSQIGFKGEERLGGGMSAWFQCASTADFRGVNNEGWCSRNSGVGFKGSFGNVWVGIWDTPFKRVYGTNNIVNQTGAFGNSFLFIGGSTSVTGEAAPGLFSRRQRNSINYDSPNFGGFQVMLATTSTNTATSNLENQVANKPRLWSVGAMYRNGPLSIGAGYEQHKDFRARVFEGDDKGYLLSVGYRLGSLRLGAMWTRQEFEPGPGAELEVDAYHIAADWKFAGPHGLRAGFTMADDTEGNFIGTIAGSSSTRIGNAGRGGTSAKLWQIHYVHTLSKRTEATIGYARLDNDSAAQYALGGVASPAPGEDQEAIGVSVRHRF